MVCLNKVERLLTLIFDVFIVAHANIMTDHVRHRAGSKMWLVDVTILANAYRFGRTDGVRHGHANLAGTKLPTTANGGGGGKK